MAANDREVKIHHVAGGFNPSVFQLAAQPAAYYIRSPDGFSSLLTPIRFQQGDPAEQINGVSVEALMAVCHDRLSQHQAGDQPCIENAHALRHIEKALAALMERTRERVA